MPSGGRRLMHCPPGFRVAYRDGCVIVGSHVYADGVVPWELDGGVIGGGREGESRLAVLGLNGR